MKRQEFVRRVCRGVLSAMACVAMATGALAESKEVTFWYQEGSCDFFNHRKISITKEEKTKTCERITTAIRTLDRGGWYYVEGTVVLDHGLELKDDAHIVLMNGSKLVIHAPDNTPGIAVRYGRVNGDDLYIYGQEQEPGERGVLEVHGGKNAAGIGGLCEESTYRHCGNIYICGGCVLAYGGENAAGIGGSHVNDEYSGDGPGRYWQFGGHVEAYGGKNAPGVGAACKGAKFCSMYMRYPDFRVLGGDLETLGGEGRYGIGAYDKEFDQVTGGHFPHVDRSLVIWHWHDIMAQYGEYYNDEYWIAHNYDYMPPHPDALIGGYADRYIRFAAVEEITKDTKSLEHDQWYHVTGKVECGPLSVSGSSHLVIEQSGDLTVKSEDGSAAWPGLRIGERSSLEVLNGRRGTLTVVHATVDGGGTLKLCGGTMTVEGGVQGEGKLELGPRILKVDEEHWVDGYVVKFEMPDGLKIKGATSNGEFRDMGTDASGRITYLVAPNRSLTLTFEPVDNQDDIAGSNEVTIDSVRNHQTLWSEKLPKRTRRVMSVPYVGEDGNLVSENAYLFEPPVASSAEVLEDGCWYVVTAKVSVASIEVKGAAHLILADGSQLRADKGGIRIGEHASLNIYGQAAGTGELIARGSSYPAPDSAGIGSCLNGAGGSVTINGGIVRATGAYNCAGIGAGGMATFGTVTINGGQVMATGGGYAAGIGGGLRGSFDEVTINGGTVTAQHGSTDPFGTVRCAPDIGRGVEGVDGPVTINGGSVKASEIRNAPKNTAGELLYKVTVECEVLGAECGVRVAGLEDYGTRDVYPVDGRVYLWLPEGTHDFTLYDGTGSLSLHYHAIVNGRDIDVEPLPVGFSVNGTDVLKSVAAGSGWSYDNKVLKFSQGGNYVLSGFATNDEVQIKVDADDAKIILSNAVVYASNRSAFVANQSTSLLMAGDTSYLAARGDFHAMTVESGASVAVDLVQERDRLESMICVLNSSDIREAIGGNGSIAVNGGTFVVWGSQKAIGNLETFSIGSGMVMKTGNDVEVAQYTTACNDKPCVIVGPAVTVTVRDGIPNVTGHTVSNALQEIMGEPLDSVTTYRVMLEDDVFVGYTLAPGYAAQVGNPLSYPEVENDIMIDESAIPTLPIVSYRAWNETTQMMETRACDVYTVVTDATATFEDDKWYVVANDVDCAAITVEGAAHLILCDDVTLTAESLTGGSLTVYGQTKNTGSLVVSGAVDTTLTVVGGNVKAGSVTKPVMNAMGQEVYGVAVECGVQSAECGVVVSGLEAYGIEKAGVIDGKVYLWLPNGAHLFSLSDGDATVKYRAVVDGAAVTAEERVSVGFSVNGDDVGLVGAGDGWSYFGKVLTIDGKGEEYVLSGTAANDEVQIKAHARYESIVLANARVATSGRPVLVIVRDNTADKGIYLKMKGGTSELSATGEAAAVQMDRSVELYVSLANGGVSGSSALAISNTGDDMPAVVNAGSLFFVQSGTLRVSAKERAFWSMPWYDQSLTGKSGDTAETAKYMDEEFLYDTPYVVIAPVCRVKVPRTLPEGIASYIVSNQTEQLPAYEYESTDEHQVFRTMLGDDITVDFKVDWGYEIVDGGNVAYKAIHEEQTVASPTVQKVQTPAWPEPQTVSGQTAAETYGIPVTSKLAQADAGTIAAWAKDSSVSVDVGDFVEHPDAYVDAFLLNCKLEEAEVQAAAYRILGFGRNAYGEWAIAVQDTNTAGRPYNGKSVIQCFTDAACKTPAEDDDPSALFIRASLQVLPAGDVPPDHGIVVPGPVRIVPVR